MTSPANQTQTAQPSIARSAFLVAAGIFLSRIAGLIRGRVLAQFLGITYVADAFGAALRIPNFLQTMFGEGVLSASFIPVYAKLIAQDKKEESGSLAGAVFSLLALVTSMLVLAGVLATPWIIALIAPGFEGETRRLTIQLVRIFFPSVGLLVLSAWCLGILNSHRKFFLSYASPVVWNAAIIAAVAIFARPADLSRVAVVAAWGSVIGSALQFLIQLPVVLRLAPQLRLLGSFAGENIRAVLHNFTPAFVGRGVNQLSAYVDQIIASFLPTSAVAGLFNAQALSLLPVSLFGMSISAAELPAMSSALGSQREIDETLRRRITSSTRRIGFFVVPSAVAFLALGDVIAGAIYQGGLFSHADTNYVWAILCGSAVGLVASTVGRLYSSAYYSLRDTRTPLRFAVVRVALTTVLGYLCALPLPRMLGINPRWGVVGLTASAGFSAWVEFLLLRRGMSRRIGQVEFPLSYFVRLWSAAAVAAGVAWGIRLMLHPQRPILAAVLILLPYGGAYLGLTALIGIEEAGALASRVRRIAISR